MPKNISQLPLSSNPNKNYVLAADNDSASITEKLTLGQLIGLSYSGTAMTMGPVSGNVAINYAPDRLIQTLSLNGTSVTFSKGTGWPSETGIDAGSVVSTSDVVLKITVTSSTTITWSIVTDWFNQPPAGALGVGTHLLLLRGIGSSVIEGHYIGSKTN